MTGVDGPADAILGVTFILVAGGFIMFAAVLVQSIVDRFRDTARDLDIFLEEWRDDYDLERAARRHPSNVTRLPGQRGGRR